MTMPADISKTSTPQPGRFSRALIRMFMKHARVVEAEAVAEGVRLVTLESPAFKGLTWTPGQKMEITMGSAFLARTFTPIDWNETEGRTRILGYAHGEGPGSEWFRNVTPGAECDIFGPRASLAVPDATGPLVVFGDETSIGLAHAIQQRHADRRPQCLLEVNAATVARAALARLDLGRAEVFERAQDDAHLVDIERRLPALANASAAFVLTGKASSIQRLRKALKSLGTPAARLATKAYWAPGKTGLD
jgi:NADPH-dependent ferric siderophore reductase